MWKRTIVVIFSLIALLSIPMVAMGQTSAINLFGDESAEINCDGRRLKVTRIDNTRVIAECKPHKETPTPEEPTATPEEPTPTPDEPTATPEEPTPTPEEPTATPEEPTPTPEEPTPTPEEPTATPEEPTPTPEEPTPTPEPPTPTPEPLPDGYTDTFPEVGILALGTCSAEVHDRYFTIGPDGNKYRTWHPIKAPIDANDPNGPTCIFAHEHGDAPHPNAPLPPFGYISKINGSLGMIAAHAGYKCFTHYANGDNGWGRPELDYGGEPINFTVCVHQGTAGAGRLSVQFHDFWFWSQYQGQETLVTVMADTGAGQSLCGGEINGEGPAGRFIVAADCHVYEQWIFQATVGNAWTSNISNFAVTNPVTYIRNGGALSGELTGNCGTDFDKTEPCAVSEITGGNQFFLGNMRTIHEPDWEWMNGGGQEVFCTDARGNLTECGPDTVQQRVAPTNMSNASARILDRTMNSQGFGANQDILWAVGVPGGN